MERHSCKLCFKRFANGRALGGHMRSHMFGPQDEEKEKQSQLSGETVSASSFLSSSTSEFDGGEKVQSYVLRENPKRSLKMVDPEFSIPLHTAPVLSLLDRESETESSKNLTRKRSKRPRKACGMEDRLVSDSKLNLPESWTDPEPLSSSSDTTTEEDLAFLLMLLSRDKKWKRKEEEVGTGQPSLSNHTRGKFKCETCDKVFKSYQALGGHRASHKRNRVYEFKTENENVTTSSITDKDKKIFECSVCSRVFSSGQALGGHKRSHGIGLTDFFPSKTPIKERFIDLNLPAPLEEDDDHTSQNQDSATSDSEYANCLMSSE